MAWPRDLAESWRSATHRSQVVAASMLLLGVVVSLVVSLSDYRLFPLAGFFVWLLLGSMLLRFRPLLALAAAVVVAGAVARIQTGEVTGGRTAGIVLLLVAAALVVYTSGRQRSGLPTPLSEALLADLRDRLNAQGRVPALPEGWACETAMVAAYDVGYAGDFMVVDLDTEKQRLDLVLVDVVGKGVKAAPSALLLAGALGGLVGAVSGRQVFEAANAFLLRQQSDDAFATAVHLSVDLTTGRYAILSAGHPPALRWQAAAGEWENDTATGLALGVMPHPALEVSEGVLGPGDALLFYTDGVVETPGEDIEDGIDWLRATAATAMSHGVTGAARRVVQQVPRGDDDRALLLLSRG